MQNCNINLSRTRAFHKALAFAGALFVSSPAFSAELEVKIQQELKPFASPESVYVDENFIYVSNVGKELAPLAKDKDGFISKLDKTGKIIESAFIKNLNAPKGMAKIHNILYVVDIDTLKGFDVVSKKEVLSLPISGAVFLNDIALFNENTLFVSDTGTGIIHKINPNTQKIEHFVSLNLAQNGGGNGLAIDSKRQKLLVAGYHPDGVSGGQILSIDIQSKKIEVIVSKKGGYDGIVCDKNGDVFISDWGENFQGSIYKVGKNGSLQRLHLPFIKGPADMFFKEGFLYVPKMAEGSLIKVKLP